jgi:hypothetical protein
MLRAVLPWLLASQLLGCATDSGIVTTGEAEPAGAAPPTGAEANDPAHAVKAPGAGDPEATASACPHHPPLNDEPGEGAAPSDTSIYALSAKLTDQHGQTIGLDVHRGHPVLVAMFYASCPNVCPLLISDLRRLEARLEATRRSQLRILLVSIDPDRDTPEVLSALAERSEVDSR